jgi:hypothetical protein
VRILFAIVDVFATAGSDNEFLTRQLFYLIFAFLRTGELVGSVIVYGSTLDISQRLRSMLVYNESLVALVDFGSGYLVADTLGLASSSINDLHVDETPFCTNSDWGRVKSLVDFEDLWDPAVARAAFHDFRLETNEAVLAVLPFPPIPLAYDSRYRPSVVVVYRIPRTLADYVATSSDAVGDSALLFRLLIVLGVVGVCLSLAVVWCISSVITKPLLSMDQMSWRIVNHLQDTETGAGQFSEHAQRTSLQNGRWFPRTEIDLLVSEFFLLLNGISGPGPSRMAPRPCSEIRNSLTWTVDYNSLYNGDMNSTLDEGEDRRLKPNDHSISADEANIAAKRNFTRHTLAGRLLEGADPPRRRKSYEIRSVRPSRSRLFWSVLGLLVLPLIAVSVSIIVVAIDSMVENVHAWGDFFERQFVSLEKDSMVRVAALQASLLQASLNVANRDLYMLARIAGWLTFEGVTRSSSFTVSEQASEGCKNGLSESVCVLARESYVSNCPCLMGSRVNHKEQCLAARPLSFAERQRQRRFYAGQVRDADPKSGRRTTAASFPKFDISPETTLWWNDTSILPGSGAGQNATGFATTYDRVRVLSALAVVEIPIYNYGMSLGRPLLDTMTFAAFDADGLMTGFSGCQFFEATVPFFESTAANGAANISVDLCPEGKFGYDPRCQKWYSAAKARQQATRNASTYVSEPFRLGWSTNPMSVLIVLSQPIMNPTTGDYVGQVAMHVDLNALVFPIWNATFLVVPMDADTNGGGASVGITRNGSWHATPLQDALLNVSELSAELLLAMKSGRLNLRDFEVLTTGGASYSVVATAPVQLSSLMPVDPSNFTRGSRKSEHLVYSVALARSASEIVHPYVLIDREAGKTLNRSAGVFVWAAIAVAVVYVVFICHVCSTRKNRRMWHFDSLTPLLCLTGKCCYY